MLLEKSSSSRQSATVTNWALLSICSAATALRHVLSAESKDAILLLLCSLGDIDPLGDGCDDGPLEDGNDDDPLGDGNDDDPIGDGNDEERLGDGNDDDPMGDGNDDDPLGEGNDDEAAAILSTSEMSS